MIKLVLLKLDRYGVNVVASCAIILAVAFTVHYLSTGLNLAYGDAESHLNISKRVVGSVTPGLAQLGGVWLPLSHVLMIPFVAFDYLWRTGLAGSIIGGASYVVTTIYIYLIIKKITHSLLFAVLGALFFAINPNILYLQSTAMTELPLIVFFVISQYYLYSYLVNDEDVTSLVYAGIFCFAATLTRYDGWFLVFTESGAVILHFIFKFFKTRDWELRKQLEGTVLAFGMVAVFGIILWLLWCALILGDPLYFTHSIYSAASQQNGWKAKGELPAYHNIWLAILYYADTAAANSGILFSIFASIGLCILFFDRKLKEKTGLAIVLMTPFVFNVITLFIGQSIIFIPNLTPANFEYHLFNVRYGVLMMPTFAILCAYLLHRVPFRIFRIVIFVILCLQVGVFAVGLEPAISLEDGRQGLSGMQRPDAEIWLKHNYDYGYIIMDDFARTVSIIKANIPMQNEIYVGNKPYYENSLNEPEKNVRWIVMQKDDEIWKRLYDDTEKLNQIYKYYEKAYSSPEIIIFKRNSTLASNYD